MWSWWISSALRPHWSRCKPEETCQVAQSGKRDSVATPHTGPILPSLRPVSPTPCHPASLTSCTATRQVCIPSVVAQPLLWGIETQGQLVLALPTSWVLDPCSTAPLRPPELALRSHSACPMKVVIWVYLRGVTPPCAPAGLGWGGADLGSRHHSVMKLSGGAVGRPVLGRQQQRQHECESALGQP